jgi:poly(A) polymerase
LTHQALNSNSPRALCYNREPMAAPIVLPRDQHTLSRRDIDPDALKVLYRLHGAGHVAYLVGGSVRDLLLGRRPKDFDVGTTAHPYQIKKLFRNCWIIGRRFRLAHVRFGAKVVEVATFRRHVPAGTEEEPPLHHREAPRDDDADRAQPAPDHLAGPLHRGAAEHERHAHRDDTFGTPEEDAFRRDFTINALFYDIATFSVIDYVGGLEDLRRGVIRCIGDPGVRFAEDPVRMLRAVVFASRLGFAIDPPVVAAITRHKRLITSAAPARLMEEYFKILRSGSAAATFRMMAEVGLLRAATPEVPSPLPAELVRSLDALDAYRARFDRVPDTLTTPLLLGSLVVPLGLLRRRLKRRHDEEEPPPRERLPSLGVLPVPRRDVERLTQVLGLQRRLLDLAASPRAQWGLTHRASLRDALTWLEIHGEAPQLVAHWHDVLGRAPAHPPREPGADAVPEGRRRRRRRGGRRGRRGPPRE